MSLGKPLALWAGLHFSTGNGVVTWLHGYIVTAKQGSSCFLRPGHIVTMSPIEGPGGSVIWVELVPSLPGSGTVESRRAPPSEKASRTLPF